MKKIMANQAKIGADMKNQELTAENLEKYMQKIAGARNMRPHGGLPSDTDPNPNQVNVVSTCSGRVINAQLCPIF